MPTARGLPSFGQRPHRSLLALALLPALGCGRVSEEVVDLDALLPPDAETTQAADQAIGEATDGGWTKAIAPREFSFPRDHGSHEDFRIEWWYYTGNVQTDNGRRFGYQLTFFRTGLNRDVENPSRWAVRDLYTAHFAVSDINRRTHYHDQRNSRAGVNRAGAATETLDTWNGDWRVTLEGDTHHLLAEGDGYAIDLRLSPGDPLILHGDGGLSQKGAAEGNASYYYSFPRLATTGVVTVNDRQFSVTGESWMDHEFSTSFLEAGQLGWDWFSLQLDDGAELMLYQMRREGGVVDPYSSGTHIASDGKVTRLTSDEFTITPTGAEWASAATGARYPLSWRLEAPSLGLLLDVEPAFAAQEMVTTQTTGIAYWEGSIDAKGRSQGAEVTARGYLELTGYSGIGLGSLIE